MQTNISNTYRNFSTDT